MSAVEVRRTQRSLIVVLIFGIVALIGRTSKTNDVFRDPRDWSWPKGVFALLAFTVLVVLLIRLLRGPGSRLLDPDALRLDPPRV
jgi:hypothetical protein